MMTYEETLAFLYEQLPVFQRQGKTAIKKDLTNTVELCRALGHPYRRFRSIHVGGTNGKGSSSHYLAAILQKAGYKVGLYTSPHLKSFTERIRINGQEVPREFVVEFVSQTRELIDRIKPSFFELSVVMAFHYFAQESVDFAVIEVGLGGRLDSTNVIQPELSLITNISYDHQDLLGNTLQEIAAEKAGIIKPKTPVVISQHQQEVAQVFKAKALLENSPIYFGSDLWKITEEEQVLYKGEVVIPSLHLPLLGKHQESNVIGVLQAAKLLKIPINAIWEGVEHMPELTNLKGRWQQLGEAPKTYCDVGHNLDGVSAVMEMLGKESYDQLHIVWGMSNDKDRRSILSLLPKDASYYCCKADVPRGYDSELLRDEMKAEGLNSIACGSVMEAFKLAQSKASPNDFIFIGGSVFVVAELPL